MPEKMMQAIRVHQHGGPEQLKLEQIPRPEPQPGEVLVRVYATGVLPIDMTSSDEGWRIIEKLEHVIVRVYAWPGAR